MGAGALDAPGGREAGNGAAAPACLARRLPGAALRAASYAAEIGDGARFALAASRLAFCGGFDLGDPEILAEAAAAAAIPLDDALAAARDCTRDGALHATARGLVLRGVRRVPAIRVGRRWFTGEHVVGEAAALIRARAAAERPLAPAS
jgi:2-hydroxychromene-2-carboxylate isomerase